MLLGEDFAPKAQEDVHSTPSQALHENKKNNSLNFESQLNQHLQALFTECESPSLPTYFLKTIKKLYANELPTLKTNSLKTQLRNLHWILRQKASLAAPSLEEINALKIYLPNRSSSTIFSRKNADFGP